MSSNKSSLIATIIVAFLAIAVALLAFYKMAQDSEREQEIETEMNSVYIPADELQEEMFDAAEMLIKQNYQILKLFYLQGMEHEDEPYGNRPEDGYYKAISSEYTSAAEIEALVNKTYISEVAEKTFTNAQGYGPIYADKEGNVLGISEKFKPDTDYATSWENPTFVVEPRSDTECKITIELENGNVKLTVMMLKLNGSWYLEELVK